LENWRKRPVGEEGRGEQEAVKAREWTAERDWEAGRVGEGAEKVVVGNDNGRGGEEIGAKVGR
jgi:hypothetical protein